MSDTLPVSAFIICKNEADFIIDCLESVAFCNDIVVVDSGSTDGTLERIAELQRKGLKIRLFQRDWPGFAAQKQFALDQAKGPWCLGIDADERVDARLAQQLASLPVADDGPAAYEIARRDYLPGYGYPPDLVHRRRVLRLVRKGKGQYDLTQSVHEKLVIDGVSARLADGEFLHFRNLLISQEIAKNDAYATLKARERVGRGDRGGLLPLSGKPLAQFAKYYLIQRYFLCGGAGFIYAAMMALYTFLTEAKLYRLARESDGVDARQINGV